MQTSGLPTRMPTPFANAGTKNTIPIASQISITPGLASFTDGFPPLTRTPIAAGGVPPYGADFNGILNAITTAVRWSNAGGSYAYDATFSTAIGGYPKGALIARSGYDGFWLSTVENNTSNPDAGGAGWISMAGQGGDYGVDTGTANAYAVAFSPAVLSVRDGMTLKFKALNANSGASTFSPNGLAAAPVVGAAHIALQGGEIVGTGDVWLQWNSSIGSGSWVLIDSTGGAVQVAAATKSGQAVQLAQMAGVNGGIRNGKMLITAASATATFTADEIAVKAALGGTPWLLSTFNKALNLGGTGAGGMDTGTAPTSGYVAIYAIYNPVTQTSALLAANATSAVAADVYGGSSMPTGYTASALVSVWPTNASKLLLPGYQEDRQVFLPPTSVLTTSTQQATPVSLSIAGAVPINARAIQGTTALSASSTPSNLQCTVSGSSAGFGQSLSSVTNGAANGGINATFSGVPMAAAQTIFYSAVASAGTMTFIISVTGYNF